MSRLTLLSGHISRNSFRASVSRKNINLTFVSASTQSKTDRDTETEQVIKTVTRKKYKELPTFKKLPNGSNAPPLGEWDGGLMEMPKPTLRAAIDEGPPGSKATTISTTDDNLPEPPRKRRKTQSMRQTEVSREAIPGEKYSKDGQSQEFRKRIPGPVEFSSISNADHVLAGKLPVKLRRKINKVIKDNNSLPDVESPTKTSTEPLSPVRLKRTRSKTKRGIIDAGSTSIDGQRRRPQNQLATEILENLAKFPHCILLTRVGNFYESYFDQAAEVAKLLSIKLTKRTWDRLEVLMCGFPIIHLDRYLKVLIQTHKRCVAMCEEFKRKHPEEGFDRRVVRVLTPGTLIDETFLNPYENNYLLAVGNSSLASENNSSGNISEYSPQEHLGIAWIDVSTGEFFTQRSTLNSLKDDLARIGPREVVLHVMLKEQNSHPVRLAVSEEGCFVSYISPQNVVTPAKGMAMDDSMTVITPPHPSPTIAAFTNDESSAITILTSFLQANLLEHMPLLSPPAQQGQQDRMQIDSQTIKALEIKESTREGGVTGSLMNVVKRTVTTSGTRLLSRWLCSPSISLSEIRARQNLVALFRTRNHLREDLTLLLKRLEDASRIVQRFLLGKGDVEDLSAIKNSIDIWEEIKFRVGMEYKLDPQTDGDSEWTELSALLHKMADLRELAQRIAMAVAANEQNVSSSGGFVIPESSIDGHTVPPGGLSTDKDEASRKWTIKLDFSPELLSLHVRLKDAEAEKQTLEETLRRRYGAPSLTLRLSGNHGAHVHVGNSKRDTANISRSQHFIPISSTGSTTCFFNQTWYMLGTGITETIMLIQSAERNAFEALRREVNLESGALRRNARIIDELDVTLGFANLASEMGFVRPVLTENASYLVVNGRHPSVELGLLTSGRVFTPNTVSLTPESRLHIITGPNMAGKSTLLRQTALLAVLAQTGSFVPADKAEMGIVDKLFSRVGAKDDLFRDRSTFMVEMLETAEILNSATEKSLVIMDEVGRGTTVKDGLAIAFATILHLYKTNRCRTLFATHFHEVADMLGYAEGSNPSALFKSIGFFCTGVDETEDGHFAYSHRLRPGVNRDSHGLKVARLAGMPAPAMRMAHEALNWMKTRHGSWIADKEQLRIAGEAIVAQKEVVHPIDQ